MEKTIGKFKVGFVSETSGQRKKHVQQMTNKDIRTIQESVKKVPNLFMSNHVYRKMKSGELRFSPLAIVKVLKDVKKTNIIEYNETPIYGRIDRRVLLRSNEVYQVSIDGTPERCNLCFVLSLDKGRIITAYWNKICDNHETINWRRYDRGLKIR